MNPPDPLAALIDFGCPEANIKGIPLWMAKPQDDELADMLRTLHRRGRATRHLADFARAFTDHTPAAHHLLICEAIDDLMDDTYDVLVCMSPPASAKALALDTPIPTPTGWKRMGDLRVGDEVFDENGHPCEVTWVSPIHRDRPVYSVRTDCGDEIIADRDHEWLVRLCGKPKRKPKNPDDIRVKADRAPTFKIKETHELCRKRVKRPMIARARALTLPHLPDCFLPVDPYLLGIWLGDGTSSAMSITSSDEDRPWLRAELHRLGYVTTDRSAPYLFGVSGVRHLFVSMGLLNDPHHNTYGRKHIPEQYLRASYEQRLALLQGLVDSDGTVCKERGCTTFCNTNLELALQVRELVRTLGVKAGWSEAPAMLNGVQHGMSYKVSFYLKDSARLPRKRVLTRSSTRKPNTYIDVTPAGTADTVCIEVNSPSHLFLCGRSMTPTHNSTYVSIAAPAYIMARRPATRIISVSRAADMAASFGGRVKAIVESEEFGLMTGIGISSDTRAKDEWVTTVGGSYFAVGASGGVLGRRADLIICDDIHTSFEDAQSETQLQKIRDWFESDLLSRLTPTGKLIVIGQRLNANDIIGYVLRRSAENPAIRIRVLKFTAECATDPEDDPLGRQRGERLWPEFYTQSYLDDKKRDPFIWKTLWMQEPPSEEGSWVSAADIRVVDTPADLSSLSMYLCTDLALSVNKGDYSVHLAVGIDHTGTAHVVDAWREQSAIEVTAARHLDMVVTYKPLESLIDDDNAAKVYMQLLASMGRERGVPAPIRKLPMRGQDKETRAAPLRGMFRNRRVVLRRAPWNSWLVKELMLFPNATGSGVDDGVDALGLIGRRLAFLGRPSAPQSNLPVKKTWQDVTLDEMWEDREHSYGARRRV